jgi:hypothetical protein
VGALLALRRRILRRRKVAAPLRRCSAAAAPTAPAPASSASAITTAIAAEVLSAAVAAALRTRIFLRGIELAKILRGRSVRIRLALLSFRVGIPVRLSFAVSVRSCRSAVFVFVREVRMQRLFVRNGLLRGVIRA